MYYFWCYKSIKTNKMKNLKEKLKDLKRALKNNTISVNEYCSMYHSIYKQINKINN